jgi:hypothetical protein
MNQKSVFAIVESEARSRDIINELKQAGFLSGDIAALLPDKTGCRDFGHEHHTKAPEGATAGGIIGAVLFGGAGYLAGVGSLAIPGLGAFIAAGPMLAALSGAAIGFATGGLAGGIIGWGIPEYEAKRYQGKLSEGNILLSVHCQSPRQIQQAREVFEKLSATAIAVKSEADTRGDFEESVAAEASPTSS